MLLMALALCFALFSFESGQNAGRVNWVGPLGAAAASLVIWAVGWVGYLAGIAAVAVAGIVLFGRLRLPSFVSTLATLAILVGSTVLADLYGPPQDTAIDRDTVPTGRTPYGAGGVLGTAAAGLLRDHAGLAGATLAGVGLVLIGIVVTFRLSMRSAVGAVAGWLGGFANEWWMQYRIDRDARRAAQQQKRDLLAAARLEQAELDRKARQKEQFRQRAYDERARVAMLQATAEAEEEARIQIENARASTDRSASEPPGPSEQPDRSGEPAAASIQVGVPGPAADPDPFIGRPGSSNDGRTDSPPADRRGNSPSAGRRGSRPIDGELPTGPSIVVDDDSLSSEPILENAADVVDRLDRGQPLPLGRAEAPTEIGIANEVEPVELVLRKAPNGVAAAAATADSPDSFGAAPPGEQLPSGVPPSAPPPSASPGAAPPVSGGRFEHPTLRAVAFDDPVADGSEVPGRKTSSGIPEDVDEDLIIHERKALETDFNEEDRAARRRRPEKPTYVLPPINLLDYEGDGPAPIDQLALKERASRLEEKLRTYGVEGKVMAIRPGPVVTTYEYQPAPGVKVAKIANLADDIAMSMEAVRVRIVAPIPGRGVVGIELPNAGRENVYLKEIVAHEAFKHSKSLLTLALGKDAEGEPQVRDLRKMPHLMIAGTTGSGKSVSINTMVLSMLYKATPDEVKFIMVDPKMLELSLYNDIPHLLLPVVTDPKKASLALAWTVDEMERRYKLLSDAKVRDIQGFNKKLEKLTKQRAAEAKRAKPVIEDDGPDVIMSGDERDASTPTDEQQLADPWASDELPPPMPFIVVLIDEFADLMMAAPRDVEASVQRLAQKARAAGIHVLLATQRPSTDVITGVIKNNFPSRLAFRVASRHDSATVLNTPGAENLLGMGDSLFLSVASPNPVRVHGAFVSEDEVERVVEFWKKQAKPIYDPTILQPKEGDGADGFADEDVDELYDQAVRFVAETRKASISAVQRKLRVGYNRAARMIEMMEAQGIVGPVQGPKGEREILVSAMGPDGPERS